MMKPPEEQDGFEDLDDDERAAALDLFAQYAPIELEVRRVKRPERQAWEREFGRILANDPILKKSDDLSVGGLHPDTLAALDEYNYKIAQAAIVKVYGLIVGDLDVSEVKADEAIELLAECGLLGYAAKAARIAQSPTVKQGEF
jgi:hypothetical protein